jgi:kynureninase
MMPAEKTYYTYSGSLTTPPCSEGVRWLLLTTPIELSAEQIEAVGMLFEHNARPIQSLNARDVLQDTSHPSVIQFILANLPHVCVGAWGFLYRPRHPMQSASLAF